MIQDLIQKYNLEPHPEGGFFSETYRSEETSDFAMGKRNLSTGIYFLIPEGKFSWWHRIQSDEMWHFYMGGPLEIWEIDLQGNYKKTILGSNFKSGESFQYLVPKGHWFGARPCKKSQFSFVGCTVAPGFDFQDFELADEKNFLEQYPNLINEILNLKEN